MDQGKLSKKLNFLLKLGKALHLYGTNAPRLEGALTKTAEAIGIQASVFSTPTYLSISAELDDNQIQRQLRVNPGVADLGRLSQVDDIADRVCSGELNISDSIPLLDEIEKNNFPYHALHTIFAYGLCSFTLAIIFGGSFIDARLSFLIGSILGSLRYLNRFSERLSQLFEFLASFICTSIAYLFKLKFPQINYEIILLASLIVIIPGLGITISMVELAVKNLVSGTARLMGAIVDFFKISFGVIAATELVKHFGELSNQNMTQGLEHFWAYPAIIAGSYAFTIIFRAKLKDFVWILLSGFAAIGILKILLLFSSKLVAISGAALAVGFLSNAFARFFNRPAMIPLLPGIIFLVPGSIGFTGINLIFNSNYSEGVSFGIQMFTVAIMIVAGLFFANVLLNPRRNL